MRLKILLRLLIGGVVVQFNFLGSSLFAQTLLNVDFGAGTTSAKVGFAATGQSTNDYWNLYSRDDGSGGYRTLGAVSNLKWADGTVSAVGVTVTNAPGAWQNGTTDPMYSDYLYPFNAGNIIVTLTNLPVGSYDLFLYGHGGPDVDTANSVFQVVSGSSDYGTKATTTTSGWTSPVWQEGQQYVVIRDVGVVNSGGKVTVTVVPGAFGQAIISGMQVVEKSSACIQAPPGLVGWWAGNGDAADTVGRNNGTLTGGVSFTSGKVGQAFDFNGIDSQVSFGNTVGNFDTNDFTIDFWIRTASTRLEAVIEKWPVCGHASMFTVRMGGSVGAGKLSLALEQDNVGGNQNSLVAARPVNDGVFHHVALVRRGTNASFYIDGILDSTASSPGITRVSNSVDLVAGRSVCVGIDGTANFTGQLDEISIYSRALSNSEIQAIYNASRAGKCLPSCATPPTGLISWWRGEGGAADQVGTNLGTVTGGLVFTNGTVGQAFHFNGIDSQVSFGNTVGNFDTNDFTIDFWMRTTATRHESVLEKWPVCGYASMWGIRIGSAPPWSGPGRLEASTTSDTAGNDLNAISAGRPVNDGLFHHVAFVRRGTNLSFYIDGVLDVASNVLSGTVSRINNTANLTAGRSVCVGIDGTFPFTGQLDEIDVFNRALSADEIAAIYQAGSAGKCRESSPACVTPPSGLVGWWKGDGGTTDAVGSNNSALVGNASFAPGVVGQAFNFDGDNDSVMIGNPAALQLQNFTIEAWIKRSSTNQASLDIFLGGSIFGYGYGGYVFVLSDDGRLTLGQVGISAVNSTMSIRDTNWHHVAVSKASGTVTFYVDGMGEATPTYNPSFYFTSSVQVGASQWDGTRPTASFLGLIDEVSVYNRALSATEIVSIYAGGSAGKCPPISELHCVPPPSGLVSQWSADGNTTDVSGGNNGNLRGDATYAAGRVRQAFSFDGIGDGVLVGNPASLQLQTFTIETWLKRNSTTQVSASSIYGEIVGYGLGGYVLGFLNDGRLFLSKNGVSTIESTRPIADTNWHCVAVTKLGSSVVFYIDGVSEAALTYNVTFDFTSSLVIGAVNDTMDASFLGLVDELSIYNRALSANEIQSVYNAGSAGKCVLLPISISPAAGFYTNSIMVSISVPATNLAVYYTLDGNASSTNSSIYSAPFALTNTATVNAQGFADGVPVTRAVRSAFRFWGVSSGCVAPDGAISWWTGDGDAQDVLALNPGSLAGNTAFAAGRIGQAFSFGAEGDAVTVANSPSLQLQNFTIEAWVRRRSTNQASLGIYGGGAIFGYGSAGYALSMFDDGRLALGKVGVSYVASTAVVTDTNWHHVAVTKSGTSVSFYVDGAAGGNTIYNTIFSFASNAAIGATGDSLIASFFGLIDELTIYSRALATNEIRSVFNAGASGKCPTFAPIIVVQPLDRTVPVGNNASFNAVAGGSPPLSYQWTFKGTAITGSTNAALTIANAQSTNAGTYAVTVSNAFGSTNSSAATLSVSVPPLITQQPQSQTVLAGSAATFSVGMTGTPPLSYQWRRNSLNVTGATSPILVINNVQPANAGSYTVRVSNSLGVVTSSPANLTVASGQFSVVTVGASGVQLTVQGEAGANYIIDVSSDLSSPGNWQPLVTLLNNPQNWQFTDTTAPGVSQRFYRLRKSP